MLENLDKIMHLRFDFDACPMHSPSGFVHLTHQNLSGRALFCLNSLAKVNMQLLIYNYHALRSYPDSACCSAPVKHFAHNNLPYHTYASPTANTHRCPNECRMPCIIRHIDIDLRIHKRCMYTSPISRC